MGTIVDSYFCGVADYATGLEQIAALRQKNDSIVMAQLVRRRTSVWCSPPGWLLLSRNLKPRLDYTRYK